MNYIELINRFWDVNEEYSFRPTTVALYFYLLKINNGCSWKESFKHNNKKIEATLDISYKSLCGARNQLKQADLIEFKTQNGISNVTYSLTFGKKDEVTTEVQGEVSDEVTGEVRTRSEMSKDKLNKTKNKNSKKDFDLSFVDVVYLGLVKEFVEYRRKDLNKPFKTARGVKQFYNELIKLSGNNLSKAKQLVEYAKGKEWQTVYAIKQNSNLPTGQILQDDNYKPKVNF